MFSAFAEVLPGSLLNDKYEVRGKIGAGGFGVVFRGHDRNLDRDVAIKIFRTPADGFEEATMDRFRREGASACRVTHASAVSIFNTRTPYQNPTQPRQLGCALPNRGSERFRRPASPRQGLTRGDILETGWRRKDGPGSRPRR